MMETVAAEIFVDNRDRAFCITFFADAILASVLRWLSAADPEPPEQYLERLHHLLVRGARQVLEDLE